MTKESLYLDLSQLTSEQRMQIVELCDAQNIIIYTQVRKLLAQGDYDEKNYDDIVDTVISAFSVIDDEVDTDKIEEMLDNAMYIEEYQDFYCSKGIKYMVDCDGSFIDISMSPEK